MKKSLKRMVCCSLVGCFLLSGCGNQTVSNTESSKESEKASTTTTTISTEVEETGITFPLKEEVTFTIGYKNEYDENILDEKCAFWQELYEKTNVKIELVQLPMQETMTRVNTMFMTGDEPDAFFSSFMKDAEVDELAGNGLLLPITEYVKDAEIMPNFHERVLSESPGTLGVITSADGEIYALPKYLGNRGNYLEQVIYINKTWLDKLGKPVPTTLEELEEILIAFSEQDMNGNGKDDEIPWLVRNGDSATHFEAFLSMYGMPTKDGTYENYTYVEDGVVKFVPIADAYKEAINKLNEWYEKGIIWQEAFTGTSETFNAQLSSTENIIGMVFRSAPPSKCTDEYVVIEPVKVEGYETRWYLHPGAMGVKGQVVLTRNCENADILVAWLDQFYALENAWRFVYGEEADGRYTVENGVYVSNDKLLGDKEALQVVKDNTPTMANVLNNISYAYTKADYDSGKIQLSAANILKEENYAMYEAAGVLNDELWPRPYMAGATTTRLGELRTDIFNTVKEKKAAWITGTADINAEWDAYVASLEKMHLDEFLKLMQTAYDNFMAGQ